MTLTNQDLLQATIEELFSHSRAAPKGDAAIDLDDAIALLKSEYQMVRLDDADAASTTYGLHDAFVALASKGQAAYGVELVSRLPQQNSTTYPVPVSSRTREVAYGVEHGRKPLISPFDGELAFSNASIGRDWYLHREGEDYCLLSELGQPMAFLAAEALWVFPKKRLIVWIWNGFQPEDLIRHVAEMYLRAYRASDRLAAYLVRDARTIAVADFHCPHMGHYVWNVLSGWDNFFGVSTVRPAVYLVYDRQNFFGGLDEIFPEWVGSDAVRIVAHDDAVFDLMLRENLFIMSIKDEQVTHALSRRLVNQSRAQAGPEFLARAQAFRDACDPLILVTLRLDNRAWEEQRQGWPALILELQKDFPRLGVMLDGLSSDSVKGWTTGWMSLEAELDLARSIAADLEGKAPVIFGVGARFCESIVLCDMVDAFLAPAGSGMAIYKWINNKPGLTISNEAVLNETQPFGPLRVWDHYRENIVKANYLPSKYVTDVGGVRGDRTRSNFSLDWRDLYPFALNFLKNLKQAKPDG